MQRLKNWKARRAGGRITITAVDKLTGFAIKIVGVDDIVCGETDVHPIATDMRGKKYELI